MRVATFALASLVGLLGCNDVRDFAGTWDGERVVQSRATLPIGDADHAVLTVDSIDKHGIRGSLQVSTRPDGPLLIDSTFTSLEAAEGDVLATMTFSGNPLRVYLAFVPRLGASDALAIISLYDSHRLELRLIAGQPAPMYAIFPLTESTSP